MRPQPHAGRLRFSGPVILAVLLAAVGARADNWPRWRGPDGNAVSAEKDLPVRWSTAENVAWSVPIEGEGASSPVVWDDRVFLTSALEDGERRLVHCLDRDSGKTLWTSQIEDDWPEITSALTGHAAATPVTDGRHVVAFFGNAGVVCYDFQGKQLWHRDLGDFESELGLASSPVLYKGRVILVCDHDGSRFKTFDSFLIALDVKTGKTVWKTDRPGLFRSWSTPVVVPVDDWPEKGEKGRDAERGGRGDTETPRVPLDHSPLAKHELIVNAQDELRAYDPVTGRQLWFVRGMTGWVTPSPVFADGMVFATSGRNGPTMSVRPGGEGDVTETHVVWKDERSAPYVCSPLFYGDLLYVHNESGVLTCYDAGSGKVIYRRRLKGRFFASAVAGDGKVYLSNDDGVTYVVAAGRNFRLLAENTLQEEILASPAVSRGRLFIRTQHHCYGIGKKEPR